MGIKPDLPNSPSPSIVQNDDGAPLNIDRLSSSVMEETNRPGFQIPNTLQGNLTNVISLLSFHQSYKYISLNFCLPLNDVEADGAVMEDLIHKLIMWKRLDLTMTRSLS